MVDEGSEGNVEAVPRARADSSPCRALRARVTVLAGSDLLPMDRCGTSDPYVKVLQGNCCLHRTPEKKKTLNPVWNDHFSASIENIYAPIVFQVFDRNLFESDDFMGQAEVNIAGFELEQPCEVTLHLEDGHSELRVRKSKLKESLGRIVVRVVVSSMEQGGGALQPSGVTGIVRVLLVQVKI
jgi:Ca2+-dependent lipid-binding protein